MLAIVRVISEIRKNNLLMVIANSNSARNKNKAERFVSLDLKQFFYYFVQKFSKYCPYNVQPNLLFIEPF